LKIKLILTDIASTFSEFRDTKDLHYKNS